MWEEVEPGGEDGGEEEEEEREAKLMNLILGGVFLEGGAETRGTSSPERRKETTPGGLIDQR